MTIDKDQFRVDLPEFADKARYPDAVVTFWIGYAVKLTDAGRWQELTDLGVELFAAHQLVLERRAMDEAAKGKVPGMSPGIVNSKSVDKVSVGYDTAGGAEPDAGHWNLTIYGTRYINLAREIGAGPIQVGLPSEADVVASAWAGPPVFNFPNPSQ